MDVKKNEYRKILNAWAIAIIVITSLILIISFDAPIEISPDAWLAYTGTIISSIVTFFVLFKTIEQNYILSEKNEINSAMPILKVTKKFNGNEYTCLYIDYENDGKTAVGENRIEIAIRNIGKGPARNIKIKMEDFYVEDDYGFQYCSDLGSNEEILLNIIFNECMIKQQEDYKYIKFILEYIDIYKKKRYKMNILAMKKTNSNFETFQKDNEEIFDIND